LNPIKVLIVDDEISILNKVAAYLEDKNLEAFTTTGISGALEILKTNRIDIAIIDVVLDGASGIELLRNIRQEYPGLEVIMISAHNNMEMVIQAMHEGAVDFLRKPFGLLDMDLALRRTKKYIDVVHRLKDAQDTNSLINREIEKLIEKEFIGVSPQIRETVARAMKAADDGDANVLIMGENGTGKEIIARIIHYSSKRRDHNFTAVNCSAIPETLLESEFFGHRKGAFTDARDNKRGLFEMASGGSILLDEIGDMPPNLQAKLLRTLEEGRVKQIGGDQEIKVDVRVISATNRNIKQLIGENKFRLDLYHRIDVLEIEIPPLRQRPEDIEPLTRHFVNGFAREKNRAVPAIKPEVFDALRQYHFPGNVRELRNLIERALILSEKNHLDLSDFTISLQEPRHTEEPVAQNLDLRQNEINLIKKALSRTNFNQNQAARLLGISRDALIRRLKKYRIKIQKIV
jgi:DNA-binding NtrC family response regulator